MKRSFYDNLLSVFLTTSNTSILGSIVDGSGYSIESTQKRAWIEQIVVLKDQLKFLTEGYLCFEYTIPRIGKRIDNVLLFNNIAFLIEFKVGETTYHKHDMNQVLDYALDLKYFHDFSTNQILVPILIATEANYNNNLFDKYEDDIFKVIKCNKNNLNASILRIIHETNTTEETCYTEWVNSKYRPTPTIIEAAQALYTGHSVEDISRSDSGAINLNATSSAINEIIDYSKNNHQKSICFITGVPGAGKTLAGLNIANQRHDFDEDEHAVFLSGNGPLVEVLQEALARNQVLNARSKIRKSDAIREAKAFIQIIHHFRDEALHDSLPPTEKVTIFDEAQRAWTKEQTSDFMRKKKGILDFDMSEPEFLIRYMDRHDNWSVIICLIGGGQEINTGEAGLIEWFNALKNIESEWNIYISNKITDNEYTRGYDLNKLLDLRHLHILKDLHLSVSLRSFRSENVSALVKAMLDCDRCKASRIYKELCKQYPLVMTRDLSKAKEWIKSRARGTERYGLISSSGAIRLKAEGIFVKNKVDAKTWFLNNHDDVRSSYYLEDVATEFDIQGLELDWIILAWGADYRYINGAFTYNQFVGSKWQSIRNENNKSYLKNAYRVLLTRARQGMVIYIPNGCDDDLTRPSSYYDGTYEYLSSIGLTEL